MTPDLNKGSSLRGILEAVISNGSEGLTPILEKLLNEAMKLEREQFLGAAPYERNEERVGYANGFKPKTFVTRMGTLQVEIPQVRGLSFYPRSLEKGSRSERALKLAIAEMYIQGVTTRKVTEITELLCGSEVSATQVSRLSSLLDDELEKFRNRSLGRYPYVFLDARYEKVRHDRMVRDLAVLIAIGINMEGKAEVLGVSVSLSEAEVHWRDFLKTLSERGLNGVELFICDDHAGLKQARVGVFPSVPWQRCQFHLSQNAQAYAPTHAFKKEIGQAMRDIFNSPSLEDAQKKILFFIEYYKKTASRFSNWLEANAHEGLNVYAFPRAHWRKIRTSNFLERINREIKRRTRVSTLFPNAASCSRLITAVLLEIHEEWMIGRSYFNWKETEATKQQNSDSSNYRKIVA